MSTATKVRLPAEIWVLIAAAFVIALGFGLVAPVLPQYAREFGVGIAAASAIVSAFALMRLLFAPASGRLVQKLGERRVYLAGILIVAVSTGACALAQTYWQLLVLRSLGGIGSTMFTVSSMALIIRVSPPAARGRVSGVYSTSFLIGSLVGPLVGGALAGLGLRAPFVIYALALLVVCVIVFAGLRESPVLKDDSATTTPELTFRQGWSEPAYRAVLLSSFAGGVAVFGVRMAFVPLLVVETLRQEPGMAGVALTVFAAGNGAVLFASGRLSDRLGRKPFLILGSAICAVGTGALGFAPSLPWFLLASFVAGIGSGMFSPVQQAALADVLGSRARGGPVLAAFQMAADLGAVLGPIVIGEVADRTSFGVGMAVTGAVLAVSATVWVFTPEPSRIVHPEDPQHPDHAGDGLDPQCTCDGPDGSPVVRDGMVPANRRPVDTEK
ncbi:MULTISPECIES: MFS transporter [Nocardia]|uniref:MFS transporter n=2 Tax=Nocardia TaxID=1817 RepID=A0A846W5Z1_9NOCA|nr:MULTISPECIES: MFS transporter [Nocardia]NKX88160.1 MFS transporter [Nocardia coubleae]TDP42029.1 putative MFS family arabinose efflux permease [Nocardia ignorata]